MQKLRHSSLFNMPKENLLCAEIYAESSGFANWPQSIWPGT